MKVTVWNLFVNFRNRTDLSIMPRNSAIQCCIVPQRQLLWEAPAAIVDSFEAATQMKSIGVSAGIHWSARVFNTSFFDGDITFLLSNGLQIRVPNSQFFTPFVGIAQNGSQTIDRSKRELLMKGLSDQPATFGRYLFTAAYLMVDHDKKSFSMWQASPSTKTSLVPSSKKVARDCGGVDRSGEPGGFGTSGGSGGSGGSFGVDDTGRDLEQNTAGTNGDTSPVTTSAITGVAIGGFVALAGFVSILWSVRRRRASTSRPSAADFGGPAEQLVFYTRIPASPSHRKKYTGPTHTKTTPHHL